MVFVIITEMIHFLFQFTDIEISDMLIKQMIIFEQIHDTFVFLD